MRNKCNTVTQSKILDGIVSISYDNANYLHIKSRLQMEGGVVDMSASDRYQYTVYAPIKYGNSLKGKGIVSWNYDSTNNRPSSNSVSFLESPFYITKLDKDILRIDITLVGKNVKVIDKMIKIDAVNTIILEKMDMRSTDLENKIQKQFAKIK